MAMKVVTYVLLVQPRLLPLPLRLPLRPPELGQLDHPPVHPLVDGPVERLIHIRKLTGT